MLDTGVRISKRVAGIAPSQTLAISNKAKTMKKEGIDIVDFGAGEPDFDTPLHIKEAAKRAIDGGFTKYTASSGIPELKEAVAKKILRDNGFGYKPGEIIISCGAKHSLFNVIFALCDEGEEVIIPSPFWLSYPEMVRMAGAAPVFVETSEKNGFRATVHQIEKAITPRTKALIINSPSNPTGGVYAKDELMAIAELAVRKNIYVISDEIYDRIVYEGTKCASISEYGEKIRDLLIIVNGVSKTYSMTGWRIGYLAAPGPIAKAIDNLQSHSTSNPTSFVQTAAVEALAGDQSFVSNMVVAFKERRDYMMDRFAQMPNLSCVAPGGAFYVFPNISRTGKSSVQIAADLLEKAHVAVVPGDAFGRDTNIRLSFASSMENIKKGLDRIEKYLTAE
jgi:aspartate aminotransferase